MSPRPRGIEDGRGAELGLGARSGVAPEEACHLAPPRLD